MLWWNYLGKYFALIKWFTPVLWWNYLGKYFARYKKHQYYSVKADELSDISNKDQMLLVLRFTDKNLEVPERI